MVDRVTETWSGVEILVNNAGIISDGLLVRMTDEAWDRCDRYQPQRDLLLHARGVAGHDPKPLGADNQHRLGGRHPGQPVGQANYSAVKRPESWASQRPWPKRLPPAK